MLADRVDIAPALMIMGLAPLAAAACAMPLPGGRLPVPADALAESVRTVAP
jgi:hypothetical protein